MGLHGSFYNFPGHNATYREYSTSKWELLKKNLLKESNPIFSMTLNSIPCFMINEYKMIQIYFVYANQN